MDKPIRITCDVPGLFKNLAAEGYGLMLIPLLNHLDRIAKRAIEIEDMVILNELNDMNIINIVVQEDEDR